MSEFDSGISEKEPPSSLNHLEFYQGLILSGSNAGDYLENDDGTIRIFQRDNEMDEIHIDRQAFEKVTNPEDIESDEDIYQKIREICHETRNYMAQVASSLLRVELSENLFQVYCGSGDGATFFISTSIKHWKGSIKSEWSNVLDEDEEVVRGDTLRTRIENVSSDEERQILLGGLACILLEIERSKAN